MLTLRQALLLPCFEKAQVVAGEAGLDQVVRRVHVVDIPDARYTWGQGALLLTAGYGLKDSPERQAALVPTLVAHGLVGLVLSTGWYFDQAPAAMRAAAEAHAFPVIEVPPEVEFIAISERLYVEIVNDQLALRERADDIHRRLTRLVLEGGRLADLAETLATFLQRSVLIESSAFEVLATAQRGPVDESRRRAVEAGRTAPDRALRLLKHGIYAELQQKLRPVRMAALPDLGMTMERVVAPVVVGREIYGYIWIVAGDHPLAALDELAIDHAATVAALVMLKEQAVREAQHAVRGDFLTQMLAAEVEPDSYTLERAHLVGYQFDHPHQALFVMGQLSRRPAAVPTSSPAAWTVGCAPPANGAWSRRASAARPSSSSPRPTPPGKRWPSDWWTS
jgi:PucR family transcriptional regulator, purine catabolism regulatory protein